MAMDLAAGRLLATRLAEGAAPHIECSTYSVCCTGNHRENDVSFCSAAGVLNNIAPSSLTRTVYLHTLGNCTGRWCPSRRICLHMCVDPASEEQWYNTRIHVSVIFQVPNGVE